MTAFDRHPLASLSRMPFVHSEFRNHEVVKAVLKEMTAVVDNLLLQDRTISFFTRPRNRHHIP